ncbi:hypothetical protein [Methylomusa anaerophila]|uniref:hypothetical protein n=1 Tax=Methylomusa anaerophila TaxID=1930071 RepID=UPI0013156C21|nr:hypothetical protein [Methylomusa anaerophila]
MKMIRLLFKDTKNIVTTSVEEIANECKSNPNELEIMRALEEMARDNEITIVPSRKDF